MRKKLTFADQVAQLTGQDSAIVDMGIRPSNQASSMETGVFFEKLRTLSFQEQQTVHQLMGLQFRVLAWIDGDVNEQFSLGTVISEYLKITNLKQSQLAHAVGIHKTRVNNIIHNRVKLSSEEAIRLEKHSQEFLKAEFWISIQQKTQRDQVISNQELRKNAFNKVSSVVNLSPKQAI